MIGGPVPTIDHLLNWAGESQRRSTVYPEYRVSRVLCIQSTVHPEYGVRRTMTRSVSIE
jgi:hypothetical protein